MKNVHRWLSWWGLALLAAPAVFAQEGGRHHRHRDHVRVECPVVMDDPGLVLARVGPVTVTACDLALARAQRVRAGQSDDAHATLRALVDDALLASNVDPARRMPDAERATADALVRADALAALADHRPTDEEIDRYLRNHPESCVRDERVHLRQIVLATEAEARAVLDALRSGERFEALLPRSIDPLAARDGGDLGLLTREGAAGVAPEVVTAGFALPAEGAVVEAPVRVSVMVQPPRAHGRRRPRAQATDRWHVVQLMEHIPEERVPEAELRRRVAARMLRDRYATVREEARARLEASVRAQVTAAVRATALQSVRVRR